MIDLNSKLTVQHSKSGVFTDLSNEASSYDKDLVTLDHVAATDYLYIGFRKPISSVYLKHNTEYDDGGLLTAEYYNGSTWASLSDLNDDTFAFKRSGFIRWSLEQANQSTNTVNSTALYWYRFKSSVNRDDIIIAGINLVFADDYDLSLEQPLINDADFRGELTSHILIHVAVRNEILQKFKNNDYIKQDSTGRNRDINCWDLHDISEVRQAAVFLALSKIYENMSDSPEDVWTKKASTYFSKYEEMINVARLSLDLNDDGVEQPTEQKPIASTVRILTR